MELKVSVSSRKCFISLQESYNHVDTGQIDIVRQSEWLNAYSLEASVFFSLVRIGLG